MTEKKYRCLHCKRKMDCIVANLKHNEEICLKDYDEMLQK